MRIKKQNVWVLSLLLMCVLFCGCATLGAVVGGTASGLGAMFGGIFKLLGQLIGVVDRMPKPPPGVFF